MAVINGDNNDNALLSGTAAADTINGFGGNDNMQGLGGADVLNGGDGIHDSITYFSSGAAVVVNLGTGFASGGDAAGDSWTGVEDLFGSNFNDTLTGDAGANLLWGLSGDDVLFGNAGADHLVGDAGNDNLLGEVGADFLEAGAGADTASYYTSAAAVSVNLATGAATGGDALGDTFSGIENLIGSAFNDTLATGLAASAISGADGNDTIIGSAGNDLLGGDAGADSLTGGAGTDTADFSGSTGA